MKKQSIINMLRDSGVSENKIIMLTPIIHNVEWMSERLQEEREGMIGGLVIDYDNGGGQSGIRENPHYKAYEALWRSYMIGMTKIIESMPKDDLIQKEEDVEPASVLELVRSKHKKGA